jgi:HEPN domain-containing protein
MDAAWRERIEAELAKAARARDEGREGLARVCARRAAGWALRAYYVERMGQPAPASAFDLLRWFHADPSASLELRHAAERLTVRVTEEHRLPHPEDPLSDARRIIEVYAASKAGDDRELS